MIRFPYKAHRVAASGDAVVSEMASSANTAAEGVPEGLAEQVPLILAVLDALGIAVVGKDGYEADDVIGTLASTAPMPVDVVTENVIFPGRRRRAGPRALHRSRCREA